MPCGSELEIAECNVCRGDTNLIRIDKNPYADLVDYSRCRNFVVSHMVVHQIGLPYQDAKQRALASYHIRKLQKPQSRAQLTPEFFEALAHASVPTPAEGVTTCCS